MVNRLLERQTPKLDVSELPRLALAGATGSPLSRDDAGFMVDGSKQAVASGTPEVGRQEGFSGKSANRPAETAVIASSGGAPRIDEYTVEQESFRLASAELPPLPAPTDQPLSQTRLSEINPEKLAEPGIAIPNYDLAEADKHGEVVIVTRAQLPASFLRPGYNEKGVAAENRPVRGSETTINLNGKQFTLF